MQSWAVKILLEEAIRRDRTTTEAICEPHANWLAAWVELDGFGFLPNPG